MLTSRSLRRFGCIVSVVLVSLSVPGASALAATGAEPLAAVAVTPGRIHLQPNIPYLEVRVTISGPGQFQVVRTFTDEVPQVEIPGTDGLYKYELRFSLPVEAAPGLAAARADDREAGIEPTPALPESLTVQRGWFTLADGHVVPAREERSPAANEPMTQSLEGPAANVVLTNGDGVIRNSLCVGFDCPDAPLFDDSTALLMENNTRIKFGDTSNAPFPDNDWEIEANSNLSGGLSYLGFSDCGHSDNDGGCASDLVFGVEAGARASALWVEDDGDVGLGTSLPVLDLHIVTGNTPSLRLEQDGSAGFTPQAWDIGANEANFFIRDVTAGSFLPFRIRPGAPTSSIDISAAGNVGIGTSAPTAKLHVNGAATIDGDLAVMSSRSAKRGFRAVDDRQILERLETMPLTEWSFNAEPDSRHLGPTAEEFHQTFGLGHDAGHVSLGDVAGVALAAVRGLQQVTEERAAKLERLLQEHAAEVAALRRDRDALALRLSELERRFAEATAGGTKL